MKLKEFVRSLQDQGLENEKIVSMVKDLYGLEITHIKTGEGLKKIDSILMDMKDLDKEQL